MSYTPFKMKGPSLYNSPVKKKPGDLSSHVEKKSLDLPIVKTYQDKVDKEKEDHKYDKSIVYKGKQGGGGTATKKT